MRLRSLDAFRGFDMFWIAGGALVLQELAKIVPATAVLAGQMTHVAWEGLRFFDCIFPVFILIAGMSFPFSRASQCDRGLSRSRSAIRVLRRMATLIFLGMVYNGFLGCDWDKLADFRYSSVLGKIGIGWGVAALVYLYSGFRARLAWLAAGLVGYYGLLCLTAPDAPAGASSWSIPGCFVGYLDRHFTPGHLYCDDLLEPSGPFVSFFAYPTALIGMFVGDLLRSERFAPARKSLLVALAGVVLLLVGLAATPVCPVIKMLWTPTYVLVTAGAGCLVFSLFHYLIDVRGLDRWSFFFVVIGENAILIYLLKIFIGFDGIARGLFGGVIRQCGTWAPFLFAVAAVGVRWALLYFLHRHKIFFKV